MAKDPNLKTISVNLPVALVDRVRRLGFNGDVSVSSVVEKSLEAFLTKDADQHHAERLKARGATLRRAGSSGR